MQLMLHKLSALLGIPLLELVVACGVDPAALQQKDDNTVDADGQATDSSSTAQRTVTAILKMGDGFEGVSGTFDLVNCTGHVDHTFTDNQIALSDEQLSIKVR